MAVIMLTDKCGDGQANVACSCYCNFHIILLFRAYPHPLPKGRKHKVSMLIIQISLRKLRGTAVIITAAMSLMLGVIYAHAFPSLFSCSTPMFKHTQTVWFGMPRTSVLLILQHADFLVVPLLI